MPNKTFSKQFIDEINNGFFKKNAWAQEKVKQVNDKSTPQPGALSRVFTQMSLQLPETDFNALIHAKKAGWMAFSKYLAKQALPVYQHFFSGKGKLPDLSLSEAEIKRYILQGILEQYTGAVSEYMSQKGLDGDTQGKMNIAIEQVMKALNDAPKDSIYAAANPSTELPSPIESQLEAFAERDRVMASSDTAMDISELLNTAVRNQKTLSELHNKLTEKETQLIEQVQQAVNRPEIQKLERENYPLELKAQIKELHQQMAMVAQAETFIKWLEDIRLLTNNVNLNETNMATVAPILMEKLVEVDSLLSTAIVTFSDNNLSTALRTAQTEAHEQINKLKEALPERLSLYPGQSPTSFTAGQSITGFGQEPTANAAKNLVADWQRALTNNQVTINGAPLSFYAEAYNKFQDEENIKKFYREILLQDLPEDTSSDKKEQMAKYLDEQLHQGGLLWPVTNSLSLAFTAISKGQYPDTPTGSTQKINIVTNENGLTVQEYLTANSLTIAQGGGSPLEHLVTEEKRKIYATSPSQPIIEAEGTVSINFSGNPSSPKLKVESNHINYGHPKLKALMNKQRSYLEMFSDFFDWLTHLLSLTLRTAHLRSHIF